MSAEDTEVLFGNTANTGDTVPNLLFVLDTSGSMARRDGGAETRLDRMKEAVTQMLESDRDMNIGLMQYNGALGGGSVLFPISHLPALTCDGGNCALAEPPAENTYKVDGNLGDVEQNVVGGNIQPGDDALELGYAGTTARAVGLRYDDINLVRGATILEARLEFYAENDQEDDADLVIAIEDVTDSVSFAATNRNVTARTFHNETVEWTVEEWYDKNLYESPDIAELVQEIVTKDDWCPGNAMAFKITGTGSREAWQNEKAISEGAALMPRLRIVQNTDNAVDQSDCFAASSGTMESSIKSGFDDAEHDENGGGFDNSNHDLDLDYNWFGYTETIGLRFTQLNIPKNATIDSAHIELTSDDASYSDMHIDIFAENSVEAVNYQYISNGPTYRSYLSSSVAWDNMPHWRRGDSLQTPDLSSLLQALVSKPDWDGSNSNNAVSFKLHPKYSWGWRTFTSHDKDPTKAAKLVVTFTAESSGIGTGVNGSATEAYSSGTSTINLASRQARDDMIAIVNGLSATGATPTVDTFYEAALYMRGENVEFGKRRGDPSTRSPRERFRISHEDSYTGGAVQRDGRCVDGNPNSSRCRSENISGNPRYISPIKGSCQANHIVLLSDGETNWNSNPPRSLSMITDKSSCAGSGDVACATDLASWLLNNDQSGSVDGIQTITTHTIAYNLEGNGKTFLEEVAEAGGGTAYEAESAAELLDVFNDLATTIVSEGTSFTAPATTVNQFNRLSHRDDIYFAVFKPAESAFWDGNIKRYRLGKATDGTGAVMVRDRNGSPAIDADTGLFAENSQSWWPEKTDEGLLVPNGDGNDVERGGVANQLSLKTTDEGVDSRNVYTWVSPAESTIATPIDLTAEAQQLKEDNDLLTNEVLNIAGLKTNSADQAEYKESLIKWSRGVDVLDQDKDGSTTDVRRSIGDPMHSRPVIVNYAPQSTGGDVRSLIFVGTNEGFLHAFDTHDGKEIFAYIPNELLGNLHTFYDDTPGFDRPYGLDGSISVWRDDTNNNQLVDSGESTYLYVGMRRGGNSYYAFDISNPVAPKLAWSINASSPGFEHLGQTWSRMTPVKMYIDDQAEDVLIFGGGYDENQDPENISSLSVIHPTDIKGAGIYIVSATSGELLWSGLGQLGGTRYFSNMLYGFNGHIRTIDINRDGYVDQMYAADTGGQLWRFDMTQYHSASSNELVDGGVIADFSSLEKSSHRRFYNEPDVALVEDNGEKFLTVSIGSGWRAHPLDEVTNDRFYVVKQHSVYEKPARYGRMINQFSSTPLSEDHMENVTSNASPASNENGWYLDLEGSGEKVLGTSVTFDSKVFFSTYLPTTQINNCAAESGSGRGYVLDVATGAPAFDLDKSSESDTETRTRAPVLTISDRSTELIRSGIPPDPVIMITQGEVDTPQILFGGETLDVEIDNKTTTTFWSDEGEAANFSNSETENND